MTDDKGSVGLATMEADGTIVLRLRADSGDGVTGHAVITYPPAHPNYESVLSHLGGLAPGETKSVPPWP